MLPNPRASDSFYKWLGGIGLHSFNEGFRSVAITKKKQLSKMSEAEIKATCKKFNMPDAAIARLLESLQKKSGAKKSVTASQSSTRPKPKTTSNASNKPKIKETPEEKTSAPPSATNVSRSKSQLKSQYYHGRPVQTNEYQPTKVTSKQQIEQSQFKQSGGSAWNPGNTTEERNLSKYIQDGLTNKLLALQFKNGLRICKVTKVEGHASFFFARGKWSAMYDEWKFEAKWDGVICDNKVSGTIKLDRVIDMQDFEEDPEEEFPELKVTKEKSDSDHNIAKRMMRTSRPLFIKLIQDQVKDLRALLNSRVGSSRS